MAEVEFATSIVGQSQTDPIIEFGRFLARIGRLDQAIVMFEGAARVAKDQRDLLAVSTAYANLGIVLKTRGDLDGAEQMYRKSLDVADRLGSSQLITSIKSLLGTLRKSPPETANDV